MTTTVHGRPVRVGAIGAGWWATTNHFPILAARDDVELVAVCRPDEELLSQVKEHFGFQFASEDYRDLLAQDLDAVVVSTPHFLHYEHARAALDAGCHVLCEKPMTLDPDEAWGLVENARQGDLTLVVPYGWHYAPFVQRAKELMDDGILGDVEYLSCFMASPTKDFFAGEGGVPIDWAPTLASPDTRTWQDPARGGGYARGQLTHSTALALWLTGLRAASVSATSTNAGAAVDLYDAAHVQFTNGSIGSVAGAATLPDGSKFQVDIRVFGTRGALLLDVERERAEFTLHDGSRISVPTQPGDGAYSCEAPPAQFIDLVAGHTADNPSPGCVAARSVELVEAIRRSANADGRRVHIASGPQPCLDARPDRVEPEPPRSRGHDKEMR